MPEAFLGAFTDKDVTVTGIHSYYSGQMRELRHREGKYLSLGYTRLNPGMSGSKFCAQSHAMMPVPKLHKRNFSVVIFYERQSKIEDLKFHSSNHQTVSTSFTSYFIHSFQKHIVWLY